VPVNKSRLKPSSIKKSRPRNRRRPEVVSARREALVAEVTRLRGERRDATFADNAMQLLTRWWASTGWAAREELLRAAEWLIRMEQHKGRQQEPGSALLSSKVPGSVVKALVLVLLPWLADVQPVWSREH
jgi:hypothetical protein